MAAKPIAVLFADSHLQERAWASREIRGDAYYSFQQIVTAAIEHQVSAVIGAGDLIDKQANRSEPIVMLNQEIDRLAHESASIPFLYIQGQHEMETRPWLSTHHWPQHISGEAVTIGGITLFGLDYTPSPHLQIALGSLPKSVDILIAHQVWGEFMGSVANPQGCFADVGTVKTMFTGDYHVTREYLASGRDGQKLVVISPGSTCMQSIDEPPEKFFYYLMDNGKFVSRQLKTRGMIDWPCISNKDQLDVFAALIDGHLTTAESNAAVLPEILRKPLLRVVYSHSVANVRSVVTQLVRDRAHIFWKEMPPEKPEVIARRMTLAQDGRRATTLASKLGEFLRSKELGHLEGPCQRLLDAQDVPGELQRLRAESLQ